MLDAERWILGLRLPFRGGSPVTLACVPLACPARAPRDLLVTPACVEAAIHSYDARGLLIARNAILGAGNNGIQVWRGATGDDLTYRVIARERRPDFRLTAAPRNPNTALSRGRSWHRDGRGRRCSDWACWSRAQLCCGSV